MAVLDTYLAEAERARADGPRDQPNWLMTARRHALERFREVGFPTLHDEEWRFTSVASIAETPFALAQDGGSQLSATDLERFQLPEETAASLVFVNGRYAEMASDLRRVPRGVSIDSLSRVVAEPANAIHSYLTRVATVERNPFTALNTAFLLDAAVVSVQDDISVDAPIHLLFVSTAAAGRVMAHPRVLVVVGRNSKAAIVESYIGLNAAGYFTNGVSEIVAGENAQVEHYKLQRESDDSAHIGGLYVSAARSASITCHSVSFGGSLVRNDVNVVLDGEGAECTLNGFYLGDRRRLVDNHTTIDHAKPNCGSREIYKGILGDHARAVFNGKIVVRAAAQKTDAKQTNKALLLSEDAQINTKPQLEIFADDVKCTHGAAIGQIDDEAMFYLRARGLGERDARRLLIRAFAGEVLRRIPLTSLSDRLEQELMQRLPGVAA
jgi:Fe-S cluster assembly protein SufD